MASSAVANVHVVCRVRPQNEIEESRGGTLAVKLRGNEIAVDGSEGSQAKFTFDHIFYPDCSQLSVFEAIGKELVEQVFEGYNGTIFAYGQTSSGKTHTMQGPDITDSEQAGLIPRVVDAIFQTIACSEEHMEFTVRASYVEIYLERIRDLLDPTRSNLQVREDPTKGIYVEGMSEHYVNSVQEMMELMMMGSTNRASAATGMNEGSSRSHAVFILQLVQKDSITGATITSKVNLVDLAGSEMVRKTGASGTRLDEAKMINLSLSALGKVINALTDGKSTHVPYRDSKLTRMLQESLGGNARTWLVINVSPSSYNASETVSTLRFGNRAKSIKNKAVVNQVRSVEELEKLLQQAESAIDAQAKYIEKLKSQVGTGEESEDASGELLSGAELNAELDDLREKRLQDQEELSRSATEIRIQQEELREAEKMLSERTEELEHVKEELKMAKETAAKLQSENIETKVALDEANATIDKLQYHEKEINLNITTLTEENIKLNKELDNLTSNLGSVQSDTNSESVTPPTPPPASLPRAQLEGIKKDIGCVNDVQVLQDRVIEAISVSMSLQNQLSKSEQQHAQEIDSLRNQLDAAKGGSISGEDATVAKSNIADDSALSRKQHAHMKALEQRLGQLVGVHRQLLRKYASLELASAESRKMLMLRDARIKKLETSVKTKEYSVKAQAERHAIELEESRLSYDRRIHELEAQLDDLRQAELQRFQHPTSPHGQHRIVKPIRGGVPDSSDQSNSSRFLGWFSSAKGAAKAGNTSATSQSSGAVSGGS